MARRHSMIVGMLIGIVALYVLAYAPVYSVVLKAHAPSFYRMEDLKVFRPVDRLLANSWMQSWYVKWAGVCGVGPQFEIRCQIHSGTGPALTVYEPVPPDSRRARVFDAFSGASIRHLDSIHADPKSDP